MKLRMLRLMALTIILFDISPYSSSAVPIELEQFPFFNSKGCFLPCFLGVDINKHEFNEVKTLFELYVNKEQIIESLPRILEFWIPLETLNERTYQIFVTVGGIASPDNKIHRIKLETEENQPIMTLGEMLDAGYSPSKVYYLETFVPESINMIILFMDGQIMVELSAFKTLDSTTPIHRVNIISEDSIDWLVPFILDQGNFAVETQWQGYTSVGNYLEDNRIPFAATIAPRCARESVLRDICP